MWIRGFVRNDGRLMVLACVGTAAVACAWSPFTESRKKEGFADPDPWYRFVQRQAITHPHLVFDLSVVRRQASEDEVRTFNARGWWPWSTQTKRAFEAHIRHDAHMRTHPVLARRQAQTIFNERAAQQYMQTQMQPFSSVAGAGYEVEHSWPTPATFAFARDVVVDWPDRVLCNPYVDGQLVRLATDVVTGRTYQRVLRNHDPRCT